MSQGENQITVAVLPRCNGIDSPLIPNRFARCSFRFIGFRLSRTFSLFIFRHFGGFYFIYGQINFLGEKEKPKAEKRKSPPFFFRVVIRGRLIFPRLACRDRNATSLDGWRAAKKLLYTFHSSLGFSMAINEEGERCCCENRKKKYPAFFLLPGGLIDPSQHKHTHTHPNGYPFLRL